MTWECYGFSATDLSLDADKFCFWNCADGAAISTSGSGRSAPRGVPGPGDFRCLRTVDGGDEGDRWCVKSGWEGAQPNRGAFPHR